MLYPTVPAARDGPAAPPSVCPPPAGLEIFGSNLDNLGPAGAGNANGFGWSSFSLLLWLLLVPYVDRVGDKVRGLVSACDCDRPSPPACPGNGGSGICSGNATDPAGEGMTDAAVIGEA